MENVAIAEKYLVYITAENGDKLLSIKEDGTVGALSLEAASEAGRVFVDSVRANMKKGG